MPFQFYGNISIETLLADMASKGMKALQKRVLQCPTKHSYLSAKIAHAKVDTILRNDILARVVCIHAQYNAENTPAICMEGTRVDVIEDIVARVSSSDGSSDRIVMLSGSAGSGKSTIAKTVASVLAEEKGILGASFFFSRNYTERKELRGLPGSLARQLADHSTDFQRLLVEFLSDDRTGILSAEPRLQFQKLVIDLLAKLPPSATPLVICLDALDECGTDHGQLFLRWLSDSIAQIPPHIRFFLTGRPDVPSYLKFDVLRSLMHGIILDEIDSTVVGRDIRLYVQRSLDGQYWTTRHPWKARAQDVDEITTRAGGLFIFAATAVRYIIAGLPQDHPQRSVDYLLRGAPLIDLHALYNRIVDDAIAVPRPGDPRARDSRDRALKVLGTILHLYEPLGAQSLASLLGMDVDDVKRTMLPLSAVIHVPEGPSGAVRVIHLSFREFMTCAIQETRADLLCGTEDQQRVVTSALLRVLRNELRFNICALPTSYMRNVEIPAPDLERRLDQHIPDHLRYSSRFWGDHLAATSYNSAVAQDAREFMFDKFLFWLEVLSLLGMVSYAPRALSNLTMWAAEVCCCLTHLLRAIQY
jgi:energy-coupling factor transporter ATP-binding protein EcfA2